MGSSCNSLVPFTRVSTKFNQRTTMATISQTDNDETSQRYAFSMTDPKTEGQDDDHTCPTAWSGPDGPSTYSVQSRSDTRQLISPATTYCQEPNPTTKILVERRKKSGISGPCNRTLRSENAKKYGYCTDCPSLLESAELLFAKHDRGLLGRSRTS